MPTASRTSLFLIPILAAAFPFACTDSPSTGGPGHGGAGGESATGEDSGISISTDGDSGTGTSSSGGGTTGSGTTGTGDESCGDGIIEPPETCDDGNVDEGDGCSEDCSTETGYACPAPGEECVLLAVCGDGKLGMGEECDDNNTKGNDGCSESCLVEAGWECPAIGSRCAPIACGDGIVVGPEQCEDGGDPPESGDGCSEQCRLEPGHFCPEEGKTCKETECGNGKREGDEPCDDGNKDVGDGCTPLCEREPTCVDGACTSTCGDGMILPGDGEECDDGNLNDGDGCSSKCKEEKGYECTLITEEPPDELTIPIIYRDFIGRNLDTNGGVVHPDFNVFSGSGTPGLVESTLENGKPKYAGICDNTMPADHPECPHNQQLTTEENFNEWYNDGDRSFRVDSTLTLTRNDSGQYVFDSEASFFPLADLGWVAEGKETANPNTNFSFTSELRYWFQLEGNEELVFSGDDDVWVFINNQLLIDLGGLHVELEDSILLTDQVIEDLGMEKGRIYEVVLFHAERRQTQSNFRLTLNGFVRTKSDCVATCGDGIVAGDEVCDDGKKNGKYGFCKKDCSGLGERCGDGKLQEDEGELCDDGTNLTSYDFAMKGEGCAPGCVPPARCGDDEVNLAFGEQCDDGNDKDDDGCESNCSFRTKCGDGEIDEEDGETCDDGNRRNGDGCSQFCTEEKVIVR